MPIRKLPLLLINQIAAGEVIERPASVVKELVENSLDAGSSRIEIHIEEGGRQLIRISDDGHGIPPEELLLALTPHATSKLSKPEDLGAIGTLGFRGEALAAIASVSRIKITSRVQDTANGQASSGASIEMAGSEQGDPIPTGCAPGTVIEIRDLFFNTPARQKFLRSASAEFAQISDLIQRMAIVRHDVAFSVHHNGRKTLNVHSTMDRTERCVNLLGDEIRPALLEFDYIQNPPQIDDQGQVIPPVQIWGLAGMPAIARATSKFQYLYVNGRIIRDRQLFHAIKEAYRGLIAPDKYPLAVIMIEMAPHLVDVNVHPAKTEVRFRNPGKMFSLVLTALRERLLKADLTPTVQLPPQNYPTAPQAWRPGGPTILARTNPANPQQPITAGTGTPSSNESQYPETNRQTSPSHIPTGYPNQTHGQGKGFEYEKILPLKEQPILSSVPDLIANLSEDQPPFIGLLATNMGELEANENDRPDAWSQAHINAQRPAPPPPILRSMGVLQVHESYLVTQDDQGLLIIDQHALHERVMFEELKKRMTRQSLESQRLLMPVVVSSSETRSDLLEYLQPLLEKIGIEASPIGPSSIGVQAFPTLLLERGVEPAGFLEELLDEAQEGNLDISSPTAIESSMHKVLDMMACKAAVKAGDKLTAEELAALLAKREEIERSSSCPHGRPTTIRLTLRDLEKQFKRT